MLEVETEIAHCFLGDRDMKSSKIKSLVVIFSFSDRKFLENEILEEIPHHWQQEVPRRS